MRKLIVTVIALAVLGGSYGTRTAQAHMLPCFTHVKKLKLKQQVICANRTIHHAKTAIIWLNKQHDKLLVDFSLTKPEWKRQLRDHQWLLHAALKVRSDAQRQLYVNTLPPNYSLWICIHNNEGSWTDSGDPFWGGLQMNRSFMYSYAPLYRARFHVNLLSKGFANSWTPLEQIWVAELAHENGKSFHGGWPNSSRTCGV